MTHLDEVEALARKFPRTSGACACGHAKSSHDNYAKPTVVTGRCGNCPCKRYLVDRSQ